MVVEHVDIAVTPGREEEFEAAFVRGREVLAEAEGFRWARLLRQIEAPSSFLVLIGWDTLEAHTVGFRESELFGQWRAVVGPFFAVPPTVVHYAGELTPAGDA
ncbi:antibiotic biosynthesis monooxygenase [Streptomyces sp. SID3343]|uniref:antibiotic biosynthesis monooxygenase family protein n=1 Tax=Streptomyces sp. SID3343 TaxID=2690260 RepID=UPI00136EB043|nr:antibiotic biosynthesis monooxygenase [Streptomyces sp. SID3343]MYW01270.1 antibiotic biosynthesis monooxygenase [Streptomyces sp. SID3343]